MINGINITHKYGNDLALQNIDIDISEGEFVALIGESGSGKSTLLSILSTLLKPSSGKIKLLGQDIDSINNMDIFRNTNIGFVFQFHYLIKYLSVFENINLASKQSIDYINDLLINLSIENVKNKYPNEISGGQRQRVALARAMSNNPKIIFADEPTGNLDSKNSQKVFELLKHRSNLGTTIVVATHDMKLAQMANTIYEVQDGRISKYN